MNLPSSLPCALWLEISLGSGAVQVDEVELLPRMKAAPARAARAPLPSAAAPVQAVPGEDEDAGDIIEEYILSDDDDDVDMLECGDAAVAPPVSAQERSRCRGANGKVGSSKGKAHAGQARTSHAGGGQGASGTCGRKPQRRLVDDNCGNLKKRKAKRM